jgi:hypothetical protein
MELVCEPESVVADPGAEVTLCCVVNRPAKFCTWYWSVAYSAQEPRTLKKFAPTATPEHGPGTDCSLVVRTQHDEDSPKELFCEVLSDDRQQGVESNVAVVTVSRKKGGWLISNKIVHLLRFVFLSLFSTLKKKPWNVSMCLITAFVVGFVKRK